jgi:hypothetical protein
MSYASLLDELIKRFKAVSYLEIGVNKGDTFFQVTAPYKVAVDPKFLFAPDSCQGPGLSFYEMTSDRFFMDLHASAVEIPPFAPEKPAWDIIFIDGLHTFEQSFRDFENSLEFSHDKTIWVLDDTVPADPYSAYPDLEKSIHYRHLAGLVGFPWHGDVFKTVFAIHEKYLDFSYCTIIEGSNPQTVVWKTPKVFHRSMRRTDKDLSYYDYFDLIDEAALLRPVSEKEAFEMIGTSSFVDASATPDIYKKLFYQPLINNEAVLTKIIEEQSALIDDLTKIIEEQGSLMDKMKQVMYGRNKDK